MQVSGRKGRYKLGAVLGTGGMATVHRASTVGSSERVAVKILHPHLVRDASMARAFRDEARLAQALDHPNIVRIVDISNDGDAPALVMDLVDGGSLLELAYGSWNRGDRIPPAVASAIVLDVLAALERAHEARDEAGQPSPVIHRDVSPHNVLVDKNGVARLADFGIARIGDETGSTMTGKVKGKLAYMAPEQFSGKRASERSDIYGAGVILWELLASERLFEGELAELVGKAMNTDRASLSLTKREVSPEVDAIALRALAKEPSERWSAAVVMAEALRTALPPATRAEVAEWVKSVAVEVPDGPLSIGDAPPSSRVETTRKPRLTGPPAASRKLAWLLPGVVALAAVAIWALTRPPPITPEPAASATATSDAQPIEVLETTTPTTPIPSESATESATVSAITSASSPKYTLPPFDEREIDRAGRAFGAARGLCQDAGAVRVLFQPTGAIEVLPFNAFSSDCIATRMRATLASGKPFAGKTRETLFGVSGHGTAKLTPSAKPKP